MGDYFDLAADLGGRPRLPRLDMPDGDPAATTSFPTESRRLLNKRLKSELRLRLRYPTVVDGLAPGPTISAGGG